MRFPFKITCAMIFWNKIPCNSGRIILEEQKMSICMEGIDHNKANVDIRALFSFTKKKAAAAMQP